MPEFDESKHPRDEQGKFTEKSRQAKRRKILNLLKQKRVKTVSKISGAISGALDSTSPEAEEHANKEYEAIRKNRYDTIKIAKNTGFPIHQVKAIKEYVFFQEHTFRNRPKGRFDADYDMALSWKRLIVGKDIWESDIILLKHELLEMKIAPKYKYHEDAHEEAEKTYNYRKSITEEKAKRNGKNRKHKS